VCGVWAACWVGGGCRGGLGGVGGGGGGGGGAVYVEESQHVDDGVLSYVRRSHFTRVCLVLREGDAGVGERTP